MQSETEVISEVGTSIGDVKVEEVKVYTSDGDLVAEYFHIYIDGELKHPRLSSKGVMRILASYMNTM